LPIPFLEKSKFQIYVVSRDELSIPIMIEIYIEKNKKLSDIKKIIINQLQIKDSYLLAAGLNSDFVIEEYCNDD